MRRFATGTGSVTDKAPCQWHGCRVVAKSGTYVEIEAWVERDLSASKKSAEAEVQFL